MLSTYAGLRVLPQSDGETVDARRETAFLSGTGGMLTVAGGKLTTYRRIALDALGRLSAELGLGRIDRAPVPLPGATDAGNVAARLVTGWDLEPAVAAHLAHYYGARADGVVGLANERPELLERIAPRCSRHRGAGRVRRAGGVGDERRGHRPTTNFAGRPRPHGAYGGRSGGRTPGTAGGEGACSRAPAPRSLIG